MCTEQATSVPQLRFEAPPLQKTAQQLQMQQFPSLRHVSQKQKGLRSLWVYSLSLRTLQTLSLCTVEI